MANLTKRRILVWCNQHWHDLLRVWLQHNDGSIYLKTQLPNARAVRLGSTELPPEESAQADSPKVSVHSSGQVHVKTLNGSNLPIRFMIPPIVHLAHLIPIVEIQPKWIESYPIVSTRRRGDINLKPDGRIDPTKAFSVVFYVGPPGPKSRMTTYLDVPVLEFKEPAVCVFTYSEFNTFGVGFSVSQTSSQGRASPGVREDWHFCALPSPSDYFAKITEVGDEMTVGSRKVRFSTPITELVKEE